MSQTTSIEWTQATWNPVTGCTKVSKGCANCYAERIAERFRGVLGHPYQQGFDLRLWPERLSQPFSWRQPRRIFVNSMSDMFHKDIPSGFIGRLFDVMEAADWHTYQILTKRSKQLKEYVNERYASSRVPPHIWLGVSIEDQSVLHRLSDLRETKATVRFISAEPLLGPLGPIDLSGIHWVIVGGESGPGFRPMRPEWAHEIRDQCRTAGIPLFFKQWGGIRPTSGGNRLDGRKWIEYPKVEDKLLPCLTPD